MTRRQKCGRNIERGERTFRVAIVVFGPDVKGTLKSGASANFATPALLIDPYELTPSINPLNGLGNILVIRRLLAANELVGRLPSEARPTDSFRPAVFLSRSSQVAMLKRFHCSSAITVRSSTTGSNGLTFGCSPGGRLEEGISSSLRLGKAVVSKCPTRITS